MSSCNNVDRIVDRRCLEGLYLPGTLASSRHRVEQTNQKAGKQTAENKRHSQQWAAKWSTCWPDSRITSPKQFTPNQKPKTELWKQSSAKFVCFASLNFHKYLLTRIFCVCSLLRNGLNLKNINRKYLYAAAEILQVTFLCQWNRQTKQ